LNKTLFRFAASDYFFLRASDFLLPASIFSGEQLCRVVYHLRFYVEVFGNPVSSVA
jgi:hypothetical protein